MHKIGWRVLELGQTNNLPFLGACDLQFWWGLRCSAHRQAQKWFIISVSLPQFWSNLATVSYIIVGHIMSYITTIYSIYIISHYKTFISPWYPDSATKMTIICGSKSIYHAMKCCSYSHDIPITFPSYINHHQAIKDIYIHIIIFIYIIVYIQITPNSSRCPMDLSSHVSCQKPIQ